MLQDGSLHPAEGEVELVPRTRREATRKRDRARIAALRQAIDVRASGVRQAEQLGHLVESFSRGVVERVPERAVAARPAHLVQRGVPTRDDQPQPGQGRRGVVEADGEQVALEVVHAGERQARGGGEGLGHLHADEQRSDQARPAGHADAGQVAQLAAGPAQRLVDHGEGALQVVARGELRDHPAVARVQVRLRVHHVGESAAARALARRPVDLHHRGGGLVAARLQAQDAHGPCLRAFHRVRDGKAQRRRRSQERSAALPAAAGGDWPYRDRFATMARTSPANSPCGSSSR